MLQAPEGKVRDNEAVLAGTLRLADALSLMVTGYVAYALRIRDFDPTANYLIAIFLSGLLALNILQIAKAYAAESLRHPIRGFGRVTLGWLGIFITLITLSYLSKTSADFSRIWLILWATLSLVSLFIIRLLAAQRVAHWHESGEARAKLAIVGACAYAESVAQHIRQHEGADIDVIGFFAPDDHPDESCGSACPVDGGKERLLGNLDDILAMARAGEIDELLVALPTDSADQIEQVLAVTRNLAINVRLCLAPPTIDIPFRGVAMFGGLPTLGLWSRPLSAWDLILKNLEDRILSALLLIFLAPLFLLIAVAIKRGSPGPILFRQQRAGFNNNVFTIYKFRTMTADRRPENGVPQAQREDPRVTPIGRFLRRTSLDELPQILNVLKGDMSLVGPRPHAIEHDEHYGERLDEYLGRQRVKPGITGWAQVNGLRGATETEEDMRRRVEYDLHYIDHWSVLLDLKILVLTLVVGFVNENAY